MPDAVWQGAPLRLAGIEQESIVDGPGLRYVLFTQGCPHNCPGCHNPLTHGFEGGFFRTPEEIFEEFSQNPLLAGMTFSGGEPFMQAAPLAWLARRVHEAGGDIVTYSGYCYEQLRAMPKADIAALLDETDILVDGPYVEKLRDLDLSFRGSSNQRLLDREDRKRLDQTSGCHGVLMPDHFRAKKF